LMRYTIKEQRLNNQEETGNHRASVFEKPVKR
jgi:hypothetical protein